MLYGRLIDAEPFRFGVDTDDEYYSKLRKEYEADPDKGVFITLDEALARVGLTVEDLKE